MSAGLDAPVKIGQRELLIGAVQVVVVLAPAKQERVNFQVLLEQPHNRNGASLADEDRLGAEARLDGPDRGPEAGAVDADQHGRCTLMSDHLDGNSWWSELADMRRSEEHV